MEVLTGMLVAVAEQRAPDAIHVPRDVSRAEYSL